MYEETCCAGVGWRKTSCSVPTHNVIYHQNQSSQNLRKNEDVEFPIFTTDEREIQIVK